MKKIITLLFAILAIMMISCNSAETKKEIKLDSTVVKIDSTQKTKVDSIAKPIDASKKQTFVKK